MDGIDPRGVTPRGLHAVVSTWLDGSDPAVHARGRKPWNITPPFDLGHSWAFEVGLLDDSLAAPLARGTEPGTPLRFGDQHGVARGVDLVAGTSWEDLAQRARPRRRWRFRFVTPVAFRRGQRYQPLPVAHSVFRHYLACVRAHAPDGLVSLSDVSEAELAVTDLDGRTESVFARFGWAVGFVGEVTYESASRSTDIRREVDLLASLAPFSGTGTHTTAGMGVTECVG